MQAMRLSARRAVALAAPRSAVVRVPLRQMGGGGHGHGGPAPTYTGIEATVRKFLPEKHHVSRARGRQRNGRRCRP